MVKKNLNHIIDSNHANGTHGLECTSSCS